MPRFEIQPLEGRVMLFAAPAGAGGAGHEPHVIAPVVVEPLVPRPSTAPLLASSYAPGPLLNATVRSTLVGRLSDGALKTTLGGLTGNAAAFDQALLDHMRASTTSRFFFGPGNIDSAVAFITARSLQGAAVSRADELMLHHFPQQGDSAVYDVHLPADFSWDTTSYSSNTGFPWYLNRFEYLYTLGQAYLYTGDDDYVREIVNLMSSFSAQEPVTDPATWSTTGGYSWDLLSAVIRTEYWVWAYQMVLDSPAWTKEANTLFVSRMWEHADFMSRATAYDPSSNRALFHAKSEMMIAHLFPEFSDSWGRKNQGRARMFAAMDAQLYADGSHVEQSPSYAMLVLEDIVEAKLLDEINGNGSAWTTPYNDKVTNALETYRQFLSPDGTLPAVGDTYRSISVTGFTKTALVQDLVTVKHSFVDDSMASTYAFSHKSLKVDDATQFAVGDQIHLEGRIEVMLVEAVDTGTNTLTVERAYDGEARNWLNNMKVYNLGQETLARTRVRDVFLFGATAMAPFIDLPADPRLGERGKIKALANSGNYIARSDGNDKNANQVIFDAGPTGGIHGHFDLFSFELYGGSRPLISDPGPYLYEGGTLRDYVISTRAHNTLNVAGGGNHAALEGANNPGIVIDQYTATGSSMHVTAHHHAYQQLAGRPVIGRSMWYDLSGTMVIVDWAEGNASHTFQQSYNLQTEGTDANVAFIPEENAFKTKYASGRNVRIKPLDRPGQTLARGAKTFVTNDSTGNAGAYMDDAYRVTVTQTGSYVYFVTLIHAYDGLAVPDTSATLLTTNAAPGQAIQVELTKNGTPQTITFNAPVVERSPHGFANASAGNNDVKYDAAGRLHLAYYDRSAKVLKYAVQETSGAWSIIETIDNTPMAGEYLSLALDSNGVPGIAWYDAHNADLNYAKYESGKWDKVKVDTLQNVGMYPSLVFSRNNGPVIAYYHHTKKDLRIATSVVGGFSIATVDSAGDVGRWTSMTLDPNRPTFSKFAIAYEDTSNGDTKYALQGNNPGYSVATVDNLVQAGGYNSLAWWDSGVAGAQRYRASISYYDAGDTALRYALHDGTVTWNAQRIAFTGNQGMYSQLFYDGSNQANIFYFDRTNNKANRAKRIGGAWQGSTVLTGGREMKIARKPAGNLAFTSRDENLGRLDVHFLPS